MLTEERYLRVFCPAHRVNFTVLGAGRILCAGGGEALAEDFPYEQFWEYCCDCQSFWPSVISKGGKAQEQCTVCERRIKQRFVCEHCKLISLESDDATRRKEFSITAKGITEPTCPGCLRSAGSSVHTHRCEEIAAEFTTARHSCPFCHERIMETARQREKTVPLASAAFVDASTETVAASAQDGPPVSCPKCGTSNRPEYKFCKKCGLPLKDEGAATRPDLDKTLALPPMSGLNAQAIPSLPPTGSASSYPYDEAAAQPSGSHHIASESAQPASATRPLLLAALVLALLIIGVLSALLIQSNQQTSLSTTYNTNTRSTTSPLAPQTSGTTNARQNATPAASATTATPQPSPSVSTSGPTAGARQATCRSNNVYVRSTPQLDETKANVIKVINRDQRLWVLGTSSNYDTTYIRSAGGNVTDNWTEVQLYDDPSVRGWVFSYFIIY